MNAQYLGYKNTLKFCPIIESKSIFTRHYFFYKIIYCVFLVISDHSRANHPKYDQDQYFDLSSKITKRYIFWLHMQLIHYCGFAFAIIFAICHHSAQKAERILHVCQKVLEFLKSAKIVLLKNGQMDWKNAMVIDKSEWGFKFHRNEKKDIILLLAGNI